MVINCPECSTKFRVSAEKIPAKGAKLRCARCRHIFHVNPEEESSVNPATQSPAASSSHEESTHAPEPSLESKDLASPLNIEEPPAESNVAAEDNDTGVDDPFGDTDFDFEETSIAPEEPATSTDFGSDDSLEGDQEPSDNIDFGFAEDVTAPEPDTTEKSTDAFGFDSFEEEDSTEIGAGTKDEFDISAFKDETSVSDDAFAFDEDYGNLNIDGDDDNQAFSFGEETSGNTDDFTSRQAEPEDEISTKDAAASFTEAATSSENVPEELPTDPYSPLGDDGFTEPKLSERAPVSKKRGPVATLILFLLVLIVGIMVAGGALYWQSGPKALQQIYQRLTGQDIKVPVKGQIRIKNLQGSFISNKTAGELLVIQGNAVNDFRESRAAIQVKGILFDKESKQLRQKTIFCGNPISTDDLRSLPYDKLEEIMGNQFGESLVNLNVTPGQVIPFMIIFRDIPENLSEFVVEVADSAPAAQ